jgi:hypothetical protein
VASSRLDETLGFCSVLLSQPHCVVIQPGERHWKIFTLLCVEADARGKLVPDAWFAALAIESGCEWITPDFPALNGVCRGNACDLSVGQAFYPVVDGDSEAGWKTCSTFPLDPESS